VKNPKMCPKTLWAAAAILLLAIWTPAPAQNNQAAGRSKVTADDDSIDANALKTIDQGRQTFRFETFGDETFWGTTIKLHQAVATLSPKKVLALGLKVDADALPKKLRNQLKHGALNLDDPANTAALLKLNAVVSSNHCLRSRSELSRDAARSRSEYGSRSAECLGAGQLRRRTFPRWQRIPPRWSNRGRVDPARSVKKPCHH